MARDGATWVLGDLHGRFETLHALWRRLDFDFDHDRLWLVGDLVNRGPRSLDVLRWAWEQSHRLEERMVVVLGNHDLHLLALHDGLFLPRAKDGDLLPILDAPDRDDLLGWLRRRRFFHRDRASATGSETVLVHAGLLPDWTVGQAETIARRLETRLAEPSTARGLLQRGRSTVECEQEDQRAVEVFSRLRMLDGEGIPCDFKGHPDQAPEGCTPWFRVEDRQSRHAKVVFGHWAALGLCLEPGVVGLDSGCAWGKQLTAYRLEDTHLVQQDVLEPAPSP